MAGKIVQQQTGELQKGENNRILNVSALAKGSYIIKVICSPDNHRDCESAVSKFVKE